MKIYVVMDGDAIRDAYSRCEELGTDFKDKLYLVKLPNGKDPFDVRATLSKMLIDAEPYTWDSHGNYRIYNSKPNRNSKSIALVDSMISDDVFETLSEFMK